MLTGIHFLLTYSCPFSCDHCFLHCTPESRGTFTLEQIRTTLDEAEKLGTVDTLFFEGGEPLLYFPLLVEGIRLAHARGFTTGMVTNAYPAKALEDALLWLSPLKAAGLDGLSISNDAFHYGEEAENPASIAKEAADQLGINAHTICIDPPQVTPGDPHGSGRGAPVIGGGARFRGRAAETLVADLPRRPVADLCQCPDEDLESPSRVHVDALGHVHLCQGMSMGNMWETPLSTLVSEYSPHDHPIAGPLIQGGPAALARALNFIPEAKEEPGYVDECHLCYSIRKAALERFPDTLAPAQVYGK